MPEPLPDRRTALGSTAIGLAATILSPGATPSAARSPAGPPPAEYTARDYSGLIGLPGFSETLLRNHFSLYQGYVKNTNTSLAALAELGAADKLGSPAAAEIRRRLGWEFNGMRLHELYFENLGGKEAPAPDGKAVQAITKSFGSLEAWAKEFRAVGTMRGIGWAALVHDGWTGRLFNTWIQEHDGGHFGACPIVLIMDVFEHAFITDYGLKRGDYVEAFMKAIHWGAVEKRL